MMRRVSLRQSQLQENLASEDLELPPEIVQALDDVSDAARLKR